MSKNLLQRIAFAGVAHSAPANIAGSAHGSSEPLAQ